MTAPREKGGYLYQDDRPVFPSSFVWQPDNAKLNRAYGRIGNRYISLPTIRKEGQKPAVRDERREDEPMGYIFMGQMGAPRTTELSAGWRTQSPEPMTVESSVPSKRNAYASAANLTHAGRILHIHHDAARAPIATARTETMETLVLATHARAMATAEAPVPANARTRPDE